MKESEIEFFKALGLSKQQLDRTPDFMVETGKDKIRLISMAPIDTQSPWRGSRFPKNICITNASNGSNVIIIAVSTIFSSNKISSSLHLF